MNNSRSLLVLFALAFLGIQVISYMTNISKHDEKMIKLDKLVQQVDSGLFFDLKMDPQVEIKKEKIDFRNKTVTFLIKLLVIAGATLLVYIIILRKTRQPKIE